MYQIFSIFQLNWKDHSKILRVTSLLYIAVCENEYETRHKFTKMSIRIDSDEEKNVLWHDIKDIDGYLGYRVHEFVPSSQLSVYIVVSILHEYTAWIFSCFANRIGDCSNKSLHDFISEKLNGPVPISIHQAIVVVYAL